MRGFIIGVSISVAFMAGATFTRFGTDSGVAHAAGSADAPTKWSYRCLTGNDAGKLSRMANNWGKQGWEMVGGAGAGAGAGGFKGQQYTMIWCFKHAGVAALSPERAELERLYVGGFILEDEYQRRLKELEKQGK